MNKVTFQIILCKKNIITLTKYYDLNISFDIKSVLSAHLLSKYILILHKCNKITLELSYFKWDGECSVYQYMIRYTVVNFLYINKLRNSTWGVHNYTIKLEIYPKK